MYRYTIVNEIVLVTSEIKNYKKRKVKKEMDKMLGDSLGAQYFLVCYGRTVHGILQTPATL